VAGKHKKHHKGGSKKKNSKQLTEMKFAHELTDIELDVLFVKATNNLQANKREWYRARERFNKRSDTEIRRQNSKKEDTRGRLVWVPNLVDDAGASHLRLTDLFVRHDTGGEENEEEQEQEHAGQQELAKEDQANPEVVELAVTVADDQGGQARASPKLLFRVKGGSAQQISKNEKAEI
jgi:hypothetical protein